MVGLHTACVYALLFCGGVARLPESERLRPARCCEASLFEQLPLETEPLKTACNENAMLALHGYTTNWHVDLLALRMMIVDHS
jgi:hypothetical protein